MLKAITSRASDIGDVYIASWAAGGAQRSAYLRRPLDAFLGLLTTRCFSGGFRREDAFAFGVLKACINMLLAHYQPQGDADAKHNPSKMADLLFAPDHSVADISRLLVKDWISKQENRALADGEQG